MNGNSFSRAPRVALISLANPWRVTLRDTGYEVRYRFHVQARSFYLFNLFFKVIALEKSSVHQPTFASLHKVAIEICHLT